MNATLPKFGRPETLFHDYRHWCVLLRLTQATLGARVIAAEGEERAFLALSPEASPELAEVVRAIEQGLQPFRPNDCINYMMLMMVYPHVHLHVLTGYATPQELDGTAFADARWPGAPDLKSVTEIAQSSRDRLLHTLWQGWPGN